MHGVSCLHPLHQDHEEYRGLQYHGKHGAKNQEYSGWGHNDEGCESADERNGLMGVMEKCGLPRNDATNHEA